jgi:ligand-binding sensor domain-containing protein
VVLRAMAKDPADRFQSADEFAQALQAELTELDRHGVGSAQAPSTPLAAPAQPSSTPVVLPAQPSHVQPAPAAPAQRQAPRPILLAGAGAAVLLIVILAVLLLRSRAPVSPMPAAAGVAAPAAGTPGSADLRYPADATKINGLAVSPNAIWAATDGGLVRWGADGSGQLFTEDDGLPLDEPGAIVGAADGTLWIGGGGVAHIRPTDSGISVVASYSKDDGLGSGVIRTLLLDSDGSIWAGGPQGESRFALSHFADDSWHTDELPADDPAFAKDELHIQSLLRSQDGALWLGLRRGVVLRWDGKRWDRFELAEGAASSSDSDTRVRRLVQSSDGTLWAAASQLGLLRFDTAQGRWQRVAVTRDTPIRTIAQFADGSLWVAGDGVIARSSDGGQSWADVPALGNIGNDIGALVQDSAGRIWAGAYDGGISVFDGTQWRQLQR